MIDIFGLSQFTSLMGHSQVLKANLVLFLRRVWLGDRLRVHNGLVLSKCSVSDRETSPFMTGSITVSLS